MKRAGWFWIWVLMSSGPTDPRSSLLDLPSDSMEVPALVAGAGSRSSSASSTRHRVGNKTRKDSQGKPLAIGQLITQAGALPGCSIHFSVECKPWSQWQHVSQAKYPKLTQRSFYRDFFTHTRFHTEICSLNQKITRGYPRKAQ